MPQPFAAAVHDWQAFYTLTGTAAATLIGLLFVAVSLSTAALANRHEYNIGTFVTPNMIHFGTVLLIGALMLVPWPNAQLPGIAFLVTGGGGLMWSAGIMRRMIQHPEPGSVSVSHWISHAILPGLGYLAVTLVGAALNSTPPALDWLPGLALASLVFLGVAIRNTWDLTVWLARNRGAGA